MKHPAPWKVRALRADHKRQEMVEWNGLDRRAHSFDVVDANGEVVEINFRTRNAATGWALVNIADPRFGAR